MKRVIVVLLGVIAILLAANLTHGTQPARSAILPCPVTGAGKAVRCVLMPSTSVSRVGQQITEGPGTGQSTPWLVTDRNAAPMAWVNLYGLYSGGDGGAMPGGLICVTYGTWFCSAALTPQGTLVLAPAGPAGSTGPAESLTACDIAWLHALELGNAGPQCTSTLNVPKLRVRAP